MSRERVRRQTLSLYNLDQLCIRNASCAPPRCRYYAPPLASLHHTLLYVDVGSDLLSTARGTMESTFFKMREDFDTRSTLKALELSGKLYGFVLLSESFRDFIR